MKIVILHYHLKPGGVTTVIRQQVKALSPQCDTLVICGEKPSLPFPGKVAVVPGAGYDSLKKDIPSPEQVAQEIYIAIRRVWPTGCDLLHVHNPLLAKNRNFLKILSSLAEMKIPLFLQVHDFAEDGRPHMLYPDQDYPANCHYGVLNTHDYAILKNAGLDPAGLHLVSNMVNPFLSRGGDKADKIDKKLVVYPIRAIRRKNIGEAILLSLFFGRDTNLAITLGPNSPVDFGIYESWKRFCVSRGLPVLFEASSLYDFKSLILSAEAMITTSISEGFGFAFLEPWTAGKGLAGRRLDICTDFEKKGVCLDNLYNRIAIPLDWIDEPRFARIWQKRFKMATEQNGIVFSPDDVKNGYTSVTGNGTIDFSLINESMQMSIIEHVASEPAIKERLARINPFLSDILNIKDRHGIIAENRTAVLKAFGPRAYAKKLIEIYDRVYSIPVAQKPDREKIARAFIKPGDFSLLKWGDYAIPRKV